MAEITLITGGARSGKSGCALALAGRYETKGFIATAEAFDDEMRDRIAKHRHERGAGFVTVEEPRNIAGAVAGLGTSVGCIVIDCMTVWLSNLMCAHGMEHETYPEIEAFAAALEDVPVPLFIVTNEVGTGIVPENALARRFRDLAGTLNRKIAERADTVILMTCGIPLTIKGAHPELSGEN